LPVCLTLEQALLEQLASVSEARGLSLSELINQLLQTRLDALLRTEVELDSPEPASLSVVSAVSPEPVVKHVESSPVAITPIRPAVPVDFLNVLGPPETRYHYPEPEFWQQLYRLDTRFRDAVDVLCMNSSYEFKAMIFTHHIFVRPEEVIALAAAPPGFRLFVLQGLLAGFPLEKLLSEDL
jgi:hypothetical protein